MSAPVIPAGAGPRPCAICGRPAVDRYRPFCSRRCADIDLGRWLKGDYRILTGEAPGSGATPGPDGPENSEPDGAGQDRD